MGLSLLKNAKPSHSHNTEHTDQEAQHQHLINKSHPASTADTYSTPGENNALALAPSATICYICPPQLLSCGGTQLREEN